MSSVLLVMLGFIAKFIGGVLLLIFTFFVGLRLWVEPFKQRCKCKTRLHGKIALVTGGNSGIGFETAKDLAKRGARVIIASRNDKKSAKAVEIIKEATKNNGVEYRHLDLAKLDSIREFAKNFNNNFDRLDILVNNAGCGEMKEGKTEHGIDYLMQINYIGPFLLTQLLLDKLIVSKPSRIVIVSSFLHAHASLVPEEITNAKPVNPYTRYARTKLCNVLWAKELAERVPQGVTVNALHPGLVMTNIFDNMIPVLRHVLIAIIFLVHKTAEEGAQTNIHLCVSPNLENSTGGYFQNCKKIKPSKNAENTDLARRLWDETISVINKY
ncbi:retinol dehydrogenase 12-like [Maniola hyperantus]|uniref:retinol dehydrogenase 12-like n=1 Tax=Aphantopus hyperantus TaxID=2795564 RepID=UPI00156A02E3|nr:retinol dehydrogenase 12-like [Maniola hyperantus]